MNSALLLALAVAASGLSTTPASVTDAESRVDKLLTAMGGREAWARTRFVHVRARHRTSMGAMYQNEIWNDFSAPRVRIQAVVDGVTILRVLNGTSGWRSRGASRSPLTEAETETEQKWWETNVYRTFHRLAARDPNLTPRLVGNRLEILRPDGTRLNWFVLNGGGEPIQFGAGSDDRGTVFGPVVSGEGGIRHWRWGASADGTFQFEIEVVEPSPAVPAGISFGPA
jgi:hypothetical protein